MSWGGDDRGLGIKRDPPIERNEDKGPGENYLPRETDSQTTDGVKAEEMVNPYLINWEDWVKWYGLGPGATNWNEPAKYSWAAQKDKDRGKCQGSKGGTNPITDPWGHDF